ncbi:hypothetical protein CHARACLAT_016242 [Characodon lateralis]|uniref:Uncharacterized protein n=1 Tax=Characodon lateralis TaxID=208331 RepID=A0ABU7F6R3_9TELE|nr:hypothetical protein [Characodon lateralis]
MVNRRAVVKRYVANLLPPTCWSASEKKEILWSVKFVLTITRNVGVYLAPGATRTTKAEYSLQSSKNNVLRGALETSKDNLEKCVDHIMKEKNIKPQKDPLFKGSVHICLLQITGYSSLYSSVEDLRKEVFSSNNPEHEAMLLKGRALWFCVVMHNILT